MFRRRGIPPFAVLLPHLAGGIVVGWGVLGALLWLDVGGFGSLVAAARPRGPVLFMLMAAFAITWGSAATGAAIMAMSGRDRPSGGHPAAIPHAAPATVPARR